MARREGPAPHGRRGGAGAGPLTPALVTGATSGIGEAFARELAARGRPLVLTGRSREPLEALGPELGTPEGRAAAAEAAAGVGLLVNNAALGGRFGSFPTMPAADLEAVLAVNVLALTTIAHAALPGMLAAGAGGIVTLSSPSAPHPTRGAALYGASKAFAEALDRSLRAETAGTGVVVTTVRPDWTRTAFHARTGQDVEGVTGWNTPQEVARAALDGHARGELLVRVPRRSPREVVRDTARHAVGSPMIARWRAR